MEKVIHYKNLPATFKIFNWFSFFTCLNYWQVGEWVYWVFWLLCLIDFVANIYKYITQDIKDIFK